MDIQSKKTIVNKSAEELFNFLTQTENFKKILPDSVEGFEVHDNYFKFSYKGMPSIKLEYAEKTPFQTVQLKAVSDMFPVFLTCKMEEKEAQQTEAQLFFTGEINMMMAMMIKKPLQDLLDTLAEKMSTL